MALELKNKTALITGASRGIGRSIALKLASLGCNIHIHYRRNLEEAQSLQAELQKQYSVKTWLYAADLSDLSEIKSFFEKITAAKTPIDIFVSNAAATAFKPLSEIKEHHIAKTMNITVTTFILVMNALKPLMPKGSKVITISGIDTKKYCANHGLLAAAKAALEMLTRYYAVELQNEGIYVHGVNPGLVDTDSLKVYWGEGYASAKAELEKLVPLGRLMSTQDVAEIVAFLCSSAADWMNGETLYADGGAGFLMPVYSGK